MTEEEWHGNTNLWSLWGHAIECDLLNERKRRLLALACCRRIAEHLVDPRSVRMLAAAEEFCDGRLDYESFADDTQAAFLAARELSEQMTPGAVRLAADGVKWLGVDQFKIGRAIEFANELPGYLAAVQAGLAPREFVGYETDHFWESEVYKLEQEREMMVQARLLRDIVGNPFRTQALDIDWRTSTVVSLARATYDDQDYLRLPILGDALEDAGCGDSQMLAHCRDPKQRHVKGCWLIDLFAEKPEWP